MPRILAAAAMGVGLLVAGCGGAAATSLPKTTAIPTPTPKATVTPTATVSVTLTVNQLPTEYGIPTTESYPNSVTITVPLGYANRIAAYGVAGTVVVGPAGWTGTTGMVGADGSAGFTLYPTGSSSGAGPSAGDPQMVFQYDGGCAGCSWTDASAYFPDVAQAIGGQSLPSASPPPGFSSDALGTGLIAYSFSDPLPGFQTNGVAFTNLPGASNGSPIFENLTLTLPTDEHSLATMILNEFVNNGDLYLCHPSGLGVPPPTTSLLLDGPGC